MIRQHVKLYKMGGQRVHLFVFVPCQKLCHKHGGGVHATNDSGAEALRGSGIGRVDEEAAVGGVG